jgi:subtilisin family serine protease
MNRQPRRGTIAAVVVASAAIAVPAGATAAPASVQPIGPVAMVATPSGLRPVVNEVLVRFAAGTPVRAQSGARSAVLDAAGAQPQGARAVEGLPGVWRVRVDEGARPAAVARRLDARADVRWAVPAVPATLDTTPNDPLFPNLWGLSNTGQQVQAPTPFTGTAGFDLGTVGAWATTRGSADVPVAVVDSGVVLEHPDLAANLRTANDRNFVPDVHGELDPLAVADQLSHGTHVAGTIGAVGNNGLGVTGVNWTAGMTTVRACDFAGSCPGQLEAMAYAGPRSRVVNLSLGGPGDLQPSTDAIKANPNTLFVVAAGNDGTDNDVIPQDPCNVPLPNVLCVAALDASGGLASFSNYGATTVDVAAPGVDIQSTVPNFTTVFTPPVTSDGATPPRPAGWTQTPTAKWTFETLGGGLNYVELSQTPGAGIGLDGWVIEAPGTFIPVGRSCRMSAAIATGLDSTQNQAVALMYKTTSDPTWNVLPASVTAGDTQRYFTPWKVDLSEIAGQTGVALAVVVRSAQGADPVFVAILNPEVKCIVDQPTGGSYQFMSGTSMATPHVTGAAALLLAKNPDLTAVELKKALMSTAVPTPSLAGKVVTGGRIDVNAALASVPSPAAPVTPATPAASITTALRLRVGSAIAVRPGGTRASVPVTCEQPSTAKCAVSVALRMRAGTEGGKRVRWVSLGTARVTLPGTWTGRVSVPLTREARGLLARFGRVRTTVIVASQAGAAQLAEVRQSTTLVRR